MSSNDKLPPRSLRALILVVLVAIAASFGVMFVASSGVPTCRALQKGGVAAVGTVVDRGHSTIGGPTTPGGREYWVEVSFQTSDGQDRSAAFVVHQDYYSESPPGVAVEIRYLPEEPETAMLADAEEPSYAMYWFGWAWISTVLVVGLFLGLRELRS